MRGIVRALGGGRGGAQEGIVELACWVISNLATVEQNRPILRKAGAMRAVVPYLGVSNGQALQQVLSVMGRERGGGRRGKGIGVIVGK